MTLLRWLDRLGDEGIMPWAGATRSTDALLAMHLLRSVQCALVELKFPLDHYLVELKPRALEEVSKGRPAEAVRLAIVPAGKAGCGSGLKA